MKFRYGLFVLGLTLGLIPSLSGQNAKSEPIHPEVQVTQAQYLGKTPPLRNLVPAAPISEEKRARAKANKQTVPNFMGRRDHSFEPKPGALPKGADAVWQSGFEMDNDFVVEPLVNIDGMDQGIFGGSPPDPCGDVGDNYYIHMVNASWFQVFDKEGDPVTAPIATNTLWSQVGFSSSGDPIILYDQEFDRWLITEFPSGNYLLVAVSETSDPMGAWDAYAFSTPSFPDYPKYSIWSNAYCVTTNEQGASQVEVYFLNRAELLSGAANPTIQRITLPGVTGGPGFYVATPVDWTGATPPPTDAKPMILCLRDDAWGSVSEDGIEIYEIDIDWDTPANTTYSTTYVLTQPFDSYPCAAPGFGFACIPQLNGGGIDGLPEVIMHQVHYRNFGSHETMVLNFITDASGDNLSGIRWMELRRQAPGGWTVYQEGTYAPEDGLHRFMGGIAMDGSGNIGMAYSISSANTYAGLAFTGRLASDPLGVMTVEEFVLTEGFSTNPGSRYGDYAQMTVDPANDRTFWFTGEYRKTGGWGTRILAFELTRDTNDIGPIALPAPADAPDLSASETVTIQVKNFGQDSQTVFTVGYIFENGVPVFEEVNYALATDSLYTHTFSATVDMSAVGAYEFALFTSMAGDQAVFNDTLRLMRSNLARHDAGISDILGLDGLGCAQEVNAQLELTNYGIDTLFSATITVILNGAVFSEFDWTGVLEPGASVPVSILLTGLANGQNTVNALTANPSGEVDQIPANDAFEREFNVITDGLFFVLELKTDEYADETTWEIEDGYGNILYSGGPYLLDEHVYTEGLCLSPDSCYTFTIFDSFGDGICCEYGEGYYQILDPSGNLILAGDGVFGDELSTDFCATFECLLTADIDISPETSAAAADGALMINAYNGIGPYQYSIDGGVNFQPGNLFENLPAGEYAVVVQGAYDCIYEGTVTIELCALAIQASVTNESADNAGDGAIEVTASSGSGPFQYSIDGGVTYQSSPLFENLFKDEYQLVVLDALGCSASLTVEVGVEPNSTRDYNLGYVLEVLPNPTEGLFRINLRGLERTGPFLDIQVFDAQGKVVQYSHLTRYGDVFTGQISLYAYPAGVYYVRFAADELHRMVRVVKQ